MTKGSPASLIVKFIIPIILGNIFQQFYNVVDTIVVGQVVGMQALAAVGATGTISFLILGFMQGLTTGFTVLTSQRFGAGDTEGVKKSVGCGYVLAIIVTVLMTALSVAGMNWLLRLMQTPEDIYGMLIPTLSSSAGAWALISFTTCSPACCARLGTVRSRCIS